MYHMDRPLSCRLPDDLRRDLDRFAKRSKRAKGEVVRDALRRYLAVEQLRAIRGKVLPLAEAQGILTDEDVFKRVS